MTYKIIATRTDFETDTSVTINNVSPDNVDKHTVQYLANGYKVRVEPSDTTNITHTDVLRFYNEHINTTAELTLSDVVNYFNRPVRESEGGC